MIPLIYSAQSSRIPRVGKLNCGCQGLSGKGDGELVFNGQRLSICEYEKVLKTDGDDGCTKM